MVIVIVGIVIGVGMLSMALSRLQHRRDDAPLVFRCLRCDHEFRQPPHARYPRKCPACGATDWSD